MSETDPRTRGLRAVTEDEQPAGPVVPEYLCPVPTACDEYGAPLAWGAHDWRSTGLNKQVAAKLEGAAPAILMIMFCARCPGSQSRVMRMPE